VALVYVETLGSKGDALRRERAIKQMKKSAKEALVSVQSGSGPVNVQAIS
jgi:putative endonuclease